MRVLVVGVHTCLSAMSFDFFFQRLSQVELQQIEERCKEHYMEESTSGYITSTLAAE